LTVPAGLLTTSAGPLCFVREEATLTEQEILSSLAEAVIDMDEDRARELAEASLAAGMEPYHTIMEGLAAGMAVVSQKYDEEEYFVPEILLCADAMYEALSILRPHLNPEQSAGQGKVVIGVISGDIHDIGKNIVKMMLEGGGLQVHDLGRDVPVMRFVDEAERIGANIIAMSTLMSTTMEGMRKVVEELESRGVRGKYKVLIGGGPISQSFADKIGADAYARDASEAIRVARRLLEEEVAASA
jgi:corrinoid protein of di/trimethylamine methyltransferase